MSSCKFINLLCLLISLTTGLSGHAFPDVEGGGGTAVSDQEVQASDVEGLRLSLLRFSSRMRNQFVKIERRDTGLAVSSPRARYHLTISPSLNRRDYDPRHTLDVGPSEDPKISLVEQQLPLDLIRDGDIRRGSKFSEAMWITFSGDTFILDPKEEKKRLALKLLQEKPLTTYRQMEVFLKLRTKIVDLMREDPDFLTDWQSIVGGRVAEAKQAALRAFGENPQANLDEIAGLAGVSKSTINDWLVEDPVFSMPWKDVVKAGRKRQALTRLQENPILSHKEIASMVGVSQAELSSWLLDDPTFSEEWERIIAAWVKDKKQAVLAALKQNFDLGRRGAAAEVGVPVELLDAWLREDADFIRSWTKIFFDHSTQLHHKKREALEIFRADRKVTQKYMADRINVAESTFSGWVHNDPIMYEILVRDRDQDEGGDADKKQEALSELALKPESTKAEIATKVDISMSKLNRWLRQEEFSAAWKEIAKDRSTEKKKRALVILGEKPWLSRGQIASLVEVSKQTISNWIENDAQFADAWKKKHTGRKVMKAEDGKQWALATLKLHPTATQREIAGLIGSRQSIIGRWLKGPKFRAEWDAIRQATHQTCAGLHDAAASASQPSDDL